MVSEAIFYLLPDYNVLIDEKLYSIETVYAGALEDDEEVFPFVICRVNSELDLKEDGVGFKTVIDEVEYFGCYESLRNRYYQLIEEIENDFA